jgi:hypothetical protein
MTLGQQKDILFFGLGVALIIYCIVKVLPLARGIKYQEGEMKINDTSIKFFSQTVDDDGNVHLEQTGEIKNKLVRGKHKARVEKIRELIKEIDDMNEGAKVLCENGFSVSRSEGRRLYTQLREGT